MDADVVSTEPRSPMPPLLAAGFYGFWLGGVPMFSAPFVAAEFGLGDEQIATVTGIASLGSFGTYALTRWADRHGRRPAMRGALALAPPLVLAAALSPGVVTYVASLVLLSAVMGTLIIVPPVAITEVSSDDARARGQSWFGLISGLGGAIPLALAAGLGDRPDGWRVGFAVAALWIFALPWLWSRIPETGRFENAFDDGRARRARMRDLLRPEYRRRTVGIVIVSFLRGAALTAVGFYTFHHGVDNLSLPAWAVSLTFVGGGAIGMVGNPLGAWSCQRYGRRPTLVLALCVHVGSAIAFYWVPPGELWPTIASLSVCFFGFNLGIQAFGVADRLIDTELFPTPLRASFAGLRMITSAGANSTGSFAVAALTAWTGSMPGAITGIGATLIPISIVLFLWVVPETRGLTLEEASLEEAPAEEAPFEESA